MADPRKTCTWRETEDGLWETECGHIYEIIARLPSDNDMAFCCYCGGKLVEVEWVDDLEVMREET